MNRSSDRIITTHVGSLPRPADLLELAGENHRDTGRYYARLTTAVTEVVAQQIEHGIDVIDDGEFGKPDFAGYINARLSGFSPADGQTGGGPMRDVTCAARDRKSGR